ncbi:uncharacterized protein LOC116943127 isoform X2 [Petromyzon marinus]|uniref:uncharacterized protein LOC116943127 isoform X2 n=1 Tax=Petromyzon marinus TaxID=7757 RepID=UPI003F702B84
MWGTPRAPSLQTSPAPAPRAPRLQPRREARGGRARSRATAPPRRSGQQAGAMKRHGADFAPPHDDGDEERSEGPLQLPFAGRIKTGIRPGMRIMVTAIVSKHPKSFAIELACGSEEGADVALRLEVHFPGRTIARNAMLGGQWGADETSVPYFPFTPGQPFKASAQPRARFTLGWRAYGSMAKKPASGWRRREQLVRRTCCVVGGFLFVCLLSALRDVPR